MIRTRGGGTVSGSSLPIRCEQAQTQVEAISSRDASSLSCSGSGGEVGAWDGSAGRGVVGSGGFGWEEGITAAVVVLVATRNSEASPAPLGAVAAKK